MVVLEVHVCVREKLAVRVGHVGGLRSNPTESVLVDHSGTPPSFSVHAIASPPLSPAVSCCAP